MQLVQEEGLVKASLSYFCNRRYFKLQTEAAWFITNLIKEISEISYVLDDNESVAKFCQGIIVTLETHKSVELILNAL
jgi:hypothetical protein